MSNSNSITGISFPFRLNSKGGIQMSGTSTYDKTHIEEDLSQLFGTTQGERPMEHDAGSPLSQYVFDPMDESLYNLIKYEVIEIITNYEDRITVNETNTTIYGGDTDTDDESTIYVELHYTINKYDDDTEYVSTIQVQ